MNTHHTSRRRLALALIGVLGFVPFNMGGCSDLTTAIGSAVGGSTGAMIDSTGKGVEKADNAKNLNEKDEVAMGESVAMAVTTKYPLVTDMSLNQYVTLVGLTLANSSDRPDRNWLFAVVDTDDVNAFSGPDGYVLITRGALALMHDESELAGVLGHEMTHVLKQHGLEAVRRAKYLEAGTTALQGIKQAAPFSDTASGLADVTLVRGYGRDEEDQADAGSVKLVVAAGYNPTGYLQFIQRLAAKQSGKGGVFSTHPGAADRASKLKKQIDAITNASQGAVLRDRFEKMTRKG